MKEAAPKNPVAELRAIVGAARAQASSEREMLRAARLQSERTELVIPPGTGPGEAARLAQEHDQKAATLRDLERRFDVVTRTEEILNSADHTPFLRAAAAYLTKIARTTKPQQPKPSDDDAPKPVHPVPRGGLFGKKEIAPPLERLAAVEREIAGWPAASFSKLAAELTEIAEQLQETARAPQPEPWRQSFPQRVEVS